MNVFQPRPAGYAHLIAKYKVNAPALLHESWLDDVSTRRTRTVGMTVEEQFPAAYAPGDSDIDHLVFALKYDAIDLAVLSRLFSVIDREELVRRIDEQPSSKYMRRLFFLFELLTGEHLPVSDLPRTPYCPVLEPSEYFVAAGRPVPRYRVHDNLLGDAGFCPIVRRTPALSAASTRDLGQRAQEITRSIDPVLLTRAISFIYTKETRSSFAIEHEEISAGSRMERFVAQLAAAGERPLDSEAALTELQNAFVDPRFAERGFRRNGEPEVYVGELLGFRAKVYHVGARSASTPALMAAWARMRPLEGPGGAVIEAACRSFAFVFIHPFGDGNGRLHRFILHDVLARRAYLPYRLIAPISAVLLADPQAYDRALESFSRRVLPLVEHKLDDAGELTILNDPDDLYRYPDLTAVCEATFGWLAHAIEKDLVEELDFLRRFDEVRAQMRDIVEMPDKREQLFIKLCLTNGGKLPNRRRDQFAELDDPTIAALEAILKTAMASSAGTPPASQT